VAGAFYPADPDQLREFVGKALKQAQPPQLQGRIVALVSPHAGYEFSGAVAAYAYKVLEGKKIDTVVVVGPSHHSGFAGALLTESDAWETPLGPVEIDHTTVAALEKAAPGTFRRDDALQAMEHSVEIQLPFLQTVLENFKFVPVLIHDFSPDNCRTIGHAIAEAVRGRDFVLVASTDLAHYPPRELCRQVDLKTLSNIEQWDIDAIYRWERQATDQYADKEVHCTMCGLGPVVAVLAAARELGADKVARLKYANSGEIDWRTADRSVGYGALAIVDTDVPQHGEAQSGQRPSGRAKAVTKQIGADRPAGGGKGMEKSSPLGTTDNLNDVQKKQLLALARKAITEWVTNRRCVKPNLSDPAFRPERAVFVTLRKHGLLRGCIGTLEPVAPLAEAVVDSAISAATEDPRFPPVRPEELSEIDIHISVLSPLRRIDRPDEIILGKHGIVVQQGLRRGVFLPEVAPEQGWDLETTLSILCVEKAGLPADAWKRGAELYVFTTQSFGEEDFNKRAAGG
ncbi:MAG: AmmeMemoRadiSam system protein B, partial [Armatimonadetes bacterium]|nr:AmmeMemoRadiSam system protein B [Armatimonadota bacterium]